MPAFFSKLFTYCYFCLKLQKNAVFPLYWEISIVEVTVDCALTWFKNAVPLWRNCVAFQLN